VPSNTVVTATRVAATTAASDLCRSGIYLYVCGSNQSRFVVERDFRAEKRICDLENPALFQPQVLRSCVSDIC